MKKLSRGEIIRFRKVIWNYYKKHGRKMPWRGEKDPYKILVSEVMLQQTQVSRVLIKYLQFLNAFPTIISLANAPFSQVLKVWQGLGYNRRARYLYAAAKEIVTKYKGKIPHNTALLEALPGLGKATAAAISVFAFNTPVAFIETNIRRVYIHYFFSKKKLVSDMELLPIVEATLDRTNSREWYYALMDYGAMLVKIIENPNKKSRHYTKQSKFVGSNREVRGEILKYLTTHNKQQKTKLQKTIGFSKKRFDEALKGLTKEGMVVQKRGTLQISQ